MWCAGLTLVSMGGCGARDKPSELGFDPGQMLADVGFLSADSLEGRGTGSRGNRLAAERVRSRFEGAGLRMFSGSFDRPFTFQVDSVAHAGVNLVGYLPGDAQSDDYLIVTAHYDHLGVRAGEIYNGADDNASGTAALLALAQYFGRHPPRHSMIFAALDAEELGLRGSEALVTNPPVPLRRIALDVNLDMISHSDSVLYAAGTFHYSFLRPYLTSVQDSAAVVLRLGHDTPDLPAGDDWTGASDHEPFHRLGIPFVYFGVEDHEDYHQPTDDFGRINEEFYVHAVSAIRDVIEVLDEHLDDIVAARRGS